MSVKIHAIKTGMVRVKSAQPERKTGGLIRILADNSWTGWLPIYAWVIDHPEGIIVVDTGETARSANDPDYFPSWHPYYRTSVKTRMEPEDEIGPQLGSMGIGRPDVRKVIMTHLHTDHAGGLHHFPETDILVSRKDYRLACGSAGRLLGYLPHRWPGWFNPVPVQFTRERFGPFRESYKVTDAGDVWIIPTPGHTPNHMSVVVISEDILYFLAGDTTYSQDLLLQNVPDGISLRASVTLDTMSRIRELARSNPVVYLPSHDGRSEDRLDHKSILPVDEPAEIELA